MSVEDKIILICGGGSGIGLAAGRILGSCGAKVILLGRSEQKLLEAQKIVIESTIEICDISKREQIASMVQQLLARNLLPDIIINCAGVHASARAFKDISPKDWDYIFEINSTGVFNLLHSFVPAMRSRGSGHLASYCV
jgi:NAD(P)-dependent dehydrogenase (short-subunit alcohol dehydrogenase family)